MATILVIAVLIIATIFIPGMVPDHYTLPDEHVSRGGEKVAIGWVRAPLRIALILVTLLAAAQTSFVVIDADKIGVLNKVYGSKSLEQGRIIAINGETGPQAEILGPGLNIKPMVKILYEVESLPVHEVPLGSYGMIDATDGLPLRAGQLFADKWKPGTEKEMMKAGYFLGEGKGQKGPQTTVLKPGKYRYNPYLFTIQNRPVRKIKGGYAGVVKSAVQELPDSECKRVTPPEGVTFSAPLVPKGCRGLWNKVLGPGTYYLNEDAYKITPIASRVQKWSYIGGYTKRWIDLNVKQNGQIEQRLDSERVAVPSDAADSAILLKIDGWEVPLELRATVQVDPKAAPIIVAAIGGLEQVENKIFTPLVRSVVRNIVSADYETDTKGKKSAKRKQSRVLELRNRRDFLEKKVFGELKLRAAKAGLNVSGVKFGDPVIPPELLVARKREQLAEEMRRTFIQEEAAQKKRIDVEKATAEADQQQALMKAEIEKKAAQHRMAAKRLDGEGEKLKLQEIAKGQKDQVAVLGKEKTMQLAVIDKLLAAAVKNPNIVKVPRISVQGGGNTGGGSLEGAFAILGDSSLTKGMNLETPPIN
ncbi:MAG: SPFH domain-containing protein [Nitrospinota bacterium]